MDKGCRSTAHKGTFFNQNAHTDSGRIFETMELHPAKTIAQSL